MNTTRRVYTHKWSIARDIRSRTMRAGDNKRYLERRRYFLHVFNWTTGGNAPGVNQSEQRRRYFRRTERVSSHGSR